MRDLDVNISVLELLGLKLLPFHAADASLLVKAKPAFELGSSHCVRAYELCMRMLYVACNLTMDVESVCRQFWKVERVWKVESESL